MNETNTALLPHNVEQMNLDRRLFLSPDTFRDAISTDKYPWPREEAINDETGYFAKWIDAAADQWKPGQFSEEGLMLVANIINNSNLPGFDFVTGLFSTRGTDFRLMPESNDYIEIDVSMPIRSGFLAHFWGMCDFEQWPEEYKTKPKPEIDVIEYHPNLPDQWFTNAHFYHPETGRKLENPSRTYQPSLGESNFNRVGIMRNVECNKLGYYFNGELSHWKPLPPDLKDEPIFFIVGLAVGGIWPTQLGNVRSEGTVSEMMTIKSISKRTFNSSDIVPQPTPPTPAPSPGGNKDIVDRLEVIRKEIAFHDRQLCDQLGAHLDTIETALHRHKTETLKPLEDYIRDLKG